MNRLKPLSGVIPPLVTPLLGPDTLDVAGFSRLIEHVLKGGVHGVFVLGTTGEGPGLSRDLQYATVAEACRQVRKRVPVLVGISHGSFAESIRLAEHAASCGADAVVLAPPYYFPAGQKELLEYVGHLAPRLPLPLFLYNMPSMTKIDISVDTLLRASELENIIGFKDSSGNMIRFHEYLEAFRDRPDFALLMGPEELMGEAVFFGGNGGVAGGANLCPELFVSLYEAARRRDAERLPELQHRVYQLRRLYFCGQYTSSIIKGIKCSLSIMGICSDFMAEPFHSFRDPERLRIKQLLDEMKWISGKAE